MKGPATASKKPRGVQSGLLACFARHAPHRRAPARAATEAGDDADRHQRAVEQHRTRSSRCAGRWAGSPLRSPAARCDSRRCRRRSEGPARRRLWRISIRQASMAMSWVAAAKATTSASAPSCARPWPCRCSAMATRPHADRRSASAAIQPRRWPSRPSTGTLSAVQQRRPEEFQRIGQCPPRKESRWR